jgi:hypothetical protein
LSASIKSDILSSACKSYIHVVVDVPVKAVHAVADQIYRPPPISQQRKAPVAYAMVPTATAVATISVNKSGIEPAAAMS